jgi:hypothetical protein
LIERIFGKSGAGSPGVMMTKFIGVKRAIAIVIEKKYVKVRGARVKRRLLTRRIIIFT